MKFETKIGIGEIVCTYQKWRKDRGECVPDLLMEVVGIYFDHDKKPMYICRDGRTGQLVHCVESELIGDPSFDQETGTYPPDSEDIEDDGQEGL